MQPEFTDTLAIKQGRHPILDKMVGAEPPVANDVVSCQCFTFLLLILVLVRPIIIEELSTFYFSLVNSCFS